MTIKTTLAALLLSTSSILGLAAGPAAAAPGSTPAALTDRDAAPIRGAAHVLAQITSGKVAPGHGLQEQTIRDEARDCTERVKNLLGRNYPSSTPVNGTDTTLGDADSRICQALAKTAEGWDERAKQAAEAERDALLEPYRKAGVAGDKLKLVHDLGEQLIGPHQVDPTPSVVAKASALFSLRHDGYRQWTIVRYAFKGNAQISVTEKGYADEPGPDQYR